MPTTLARWDPFQQLADMQREFDRILGRTHGDGDQVQHAWVPVADVEQTADGMVLKFDLPGMTEKDVTIEIEGRSLTVSGERREEKEDKHEGYYTRERLVGQFRRSFMLPEGVDESRIEATFRNGVLTVSIPRPQVEKPRRVEISTTK